MICYETIVEIFNQWMNNNSIRSISGHLGIHRSTVTKYINQFKKNISDLGLQDNEIRAHCNDIVMKVNYHTNGTRKTKVSIDIENKILKLMKSNNWKKYSKKSEFINCTTIYNIIYDEFKDRFNGTGIGYSTICEIINKINDDYLFSDSNDDM